MKLRVRYNEATDLEVEAPTLKGLIEQVGSVNEIMSLLGTEACGICDSTDTVFNFRQVETFRYYELKCVSCASVLPLGQKLNGVDLFPQRRIGKGEKAKPKPDRGWEQYDPTRNREEPEAEPEPEPETPKRKKASR